jgi:Rrf2 family protein
MKISAKSEYACFAVMDLALNYSFSVPIGSEEIAKRQGIPFKYLEQILLELKKDGIVNSIRGQKGGYFLSKPPRQISLFEVINSVEGVLFPLKCFKEGGRHTCVKEINCSFKPIWNEIADKTSQIMKNVNFEDICERVKNGEGRMYYI